MSLELLEINQCLLGKNEATGSGGAIDTTGVKQVHFIDSTLTQNSLTGVAGNGGAAHLYLSEVVVVVGCLIANNTAQSPGGGGGIRTNNCKSVKVHDITFRFNAGATHGGGLLTSMTGFSGHIELVELVRCTFWRNSAGRGGGSAHWRSEG